MGFLWDRYKKVKERTKGIREGLDDISKVTYDVSKNNPYARQIKKEMRKR